MFISGVEYSVILPTALLYMKRFNVNNIFMGLIVSLYPVGAIISLPLFGYLYDKTKRIKELLLVLNLFQIIGNVLYALHFSMWFPLVGRFISGMGDGFISCVSGELTQIYPPNTRLTILSLLEIGRVFGLMIGPSLNLVIEKENFKVNSWVLDKTTLPGVAMACIWFINELMTFCCVYNIRKEIEESPKFINIDTPKLNAETQTSVKLESFIYNDNFDEIESETTSSSHLLSDNFQDKLPNDVKTKEKEFQRPNLLYKYWLQTTKAIFSFEFFIIFFADLVLWMIQTQFELLLPYITEFNYKWSPSSASFVYVGGSCIILIVFLIIIFLSKKIVIQEYYLMLFALVLTTISVGLVILESVTLQYNLRIAVFFVVCSLMFIALPFNLVSTKSLTMKMFPAENQGIIQGFFSSATRIAMIGGPIAMSFVLEKRQTYGIVAMTICLLVIVCLSFAINRIKKLIQQNEKNFLGA
ncbi:major facilitator superfamily domain-containing protein 8 [Hydra vulgaris]|uniref:major facilitator superfamily domain-containing protein 8 n=1 Tax=Hydra vulgaris TaxID=6087 RepID=UPI0032EA2A77